MSFNRENAGNGWRQIPSLVAVALVSSLVTVLLYSAVFSPRHRQPGPLASGSCGDACVKKLSNSTTYGKKFEEPCPAWIGEYARFHAWSLTQPNPKFLVYLCGVDSKDNKHKTMWCCSGTGDRLRAMQEMLRLAAYFNRTLLIHWSKPTRLENLFSPSGLIDWRVKEEYGINLRKSVHYTWSGNRFPPEVADGDFKDEHKDAPVITMTTNTRTIRGKAKFPPEFGPYTGSKRACAFHALFKPTVVLEDRIASIRRELFGSASTPYVAIHLRLGGLEGEAEDIKRFDGLKGLLSSMMCAEHLSCRSNISAPVLVLTDNSRLRTFIASGHLEGVVGPSTKSAHLGYAKGAEDALYEAALATFTDLGLLANARCMIASPSMFADMATQWGRPACRAEVKECINIFSPSVPREVIEHKAMRKARRTEGTVRALRLLSSQG